MSNQSSVASVMAKSDPILPPSLAEIEALAEEALTSIPEKLRVHAKDIVIQVTEFCDEGTEREMKLESPFDVMGLYRGIGMPHRSESAPHYEPDLVYLYRRPILDYWAETGEDLRHVVRHVLIHEIGHHFGFSDADMDAIENED
jgi:predicted Zn-dependent protease with MMP-like domain